VRTPEDRSPEGHRGPNTTPVEAAKREIRLLRALRGLALSWATTAVLLAIFVGGYVVGHGDAVGPPRTLLSSWLTQVGLLSSASARGPVPAPSEELEGVFQPFWEAWGYVTRDYYSAEKVEPQTLSRGAIRGMLASIEDPYTLYVDPRHREVTEAELRGAFDGIGVQVEMVSERLRVVAPLEGSPGERAGIKTGDVISHVDGREIRGMDLAEAIRLIRGPRGSEVLLTVLRDSLTPFDLSVVREEIRISAVRGEVRPDGIGYLRITNFSLRVGADLRETIERLTAGSPRGWILDLRSNPGGYLDGAVSVTSAFIADKIVLYEERRGEDREAINTRGEATATTRPVAILVDGGTASASEIVAAALRDHGRATVFGERTYGKGTVQVVHSLSDGSALRLTIARWLTPSGDPIQGVGLDPQIEVTPEEGSDRVLERAVDWLMQQQAQAPELLDLPPLTAVSSSQEPARVGMLDPWEQASAPEGTA
jgi:carboxyl-terminal processing protease